VGDSPFDLRAGRAAGTRTAAVCWGACTRDALVAESPDYVLERLEELLDPDAARSTVGSPAA
jgi:phosphoglycolate phosphatase-like HAD superfamily hydrolase